jgi:hypothetical protein
MANNKIAKRLFALVVFVIIICGGFEPLYESSAAEAVFGPNNKVLDVIVGKWITEGQTKGSANTASVKIHASDIYEWVSGGVFVLHTAYGRIGSVDAERVEIIGYDKATRNYQSHFFDSQGNIGTDQLTIDGNVWKWQGTKTRATGVFSENGKTLTAQHERSDDGVHWVPSMDVVLRKIE